MITESPFDEKTHAVMHAWRTSTGITYSGVLTAIKPPYFIHGASQPKWMMDESGNQVVRKSPMKHGVACEAIASELADATGFPVPPVRIYRESATGKPDQFFAVSLRAFPNSRDTPPLDILMRDPNYFNALVFDQWVKNLDRNGGAILYDPEAGASNYRTAYADFERMSCIDAGSAHPFFGLSGLSPLSRTNEYKVTPALKQATVAQIEQPETRAFMSRIEAVPDAKIRDTVASKPDALFDNYFPKDKLTDCLLYRRDNIRALCKQSIALG